MDQSQLKWIADFIWNIADDRLRDVYVRGKYRDVILPFTVLRRLDAVLESSKDAVLERLCCINRGKDKQPLSPNRQTDLGHDHGDRRSQLGKPIQ